MVAKGFAHAHFPISPRQNAEDNTNVWLLPKRSHDLAGSRNDIEKLIRPAHLDIDVKVISIVTLHDCVEEFVQVNWFVFLPAFVEVITRQELLNGEIGCQTDEVSHG